MPTLPNNIKSAPGQLHVKAMIWENQPFKKRNKVIQSFVYNEDTIPLLFKQLENQISIFYGPNSGIYLKEKYVYRDVFLKIKGELVEANRDLMYDFKNNDLFDPVTKKATAPWIDHQTFNLVGSIYGLNKDIYTNSEVQAGTIPDGKMYSSWQLITKEFPRALMGKPGVEGFEDEMDVGIDFEIAQDESAFFESAEDYGIRVRTDGTEADAFAEENAFAYVRARQTMRFVPTQTKASSILTKDGQSAPTPIHWLVEKDTPLFRGEDFFVEFFRTASPDVVPLDTMLDPYFAPIDTNTDQKISYATSYASNSTVSTSNDPVSIGMFDFVPKATTSATQIKEAKELFNFGKQAYYLVELGVGDPNNNYFIILAENSVPRFVQVGKMPVVMQDETGNDFIATPKQKVSRIMSSYDVSCRSLMFGTENLRMTVRNHNGRLAITFSGLEDRPWVIDRWDYDLEKSNSKSNTTKDKFQIPYHAHTSPKKIRIGAGNLMCAFTFGPLHYEPEARISLPNGFSAQGPFTKSEKDQIFSCLLRDQNSRVLNNNVIIKNTLSSSGAYNLNNLKPVYSQDADLYLEFVDGQQKAFSRIKSLGIDTGLSELYWLKGYNGPNDPSNRDFLTTVPIQNGQPPNVRPASTTGHLSTIGIIPMRVKAKPSDANVPVFNAPVLINENEEAEVATELMDKVRQFNALYLLYAGDARLFKTEDDESAVFASTTPDPKKDWILANCITPIATGWRLEVKESKDFTHELCPVDVAHHVESLSISSSFDGTRIQRSGSIRFNINIGGLSSLTPAPDGLFSQSTPCNPNDPYSIDRSNYLTECSSRNFYIRIYAWWEGGFMDCNINGCPCKTSASASNSADHRILFTGFCEESKITTEGVKRYMDCQLVDYWHAFEHIKIWNSPFFDGMRDFNVVHELANMSGLSETKGTYEKYPPLSFLKKTIDLPPGKITLQNFLGDTYYLRDYALPTSYDVLQSPLFKFDDNSSISDAIMRIAEQSSKIVHFDRFGILKYETPPHMLICYGKDAQGNSVASPKCRFYASTYNMPGPCRNLDSLTINPYSYSKKVQDTYNEIFGITSTPEGEIINAGSVNLDSKINPLKEGYLGYKKMLVVSDGMFGSAKALQNVINYYSAFYRAPITLSFDSFGIARISAGDIVSFTGLKEDESFPKKNIEDTTNPDNTATVYLTSVSCEINPKDHSWVNRYEGEWVFFNEAVCGNEG